MCECSQIGTRGDHGSTWQGMLSGGTSASDLLLGEDLGYGGLLSCLTLKRESGSIFLA